MAFSTIACSSDDSESVKEPSVKFEEENNTIIPITDATVSTGPESPSVPGVSESKITVSNEGVIADASKVSIKLDLQHTWAGDLVVQVFTPSGESCTLIKRLGTSNVGSSSDFVPENRIVFNSTATTSINDAAISLATLIIPAGIYLPGKGYNISPQEILMTDLAAFLNGKSIKGDWKIRIGDHSNSDIGRLHSWKLEFDTGALQ